jgi:hypothetical protein
MSIEFWTAFNAIASGFTALAVIVALFQLRGARQQAHRDFENLYVQRFWEISDSFSASSRTHLPDRKFKRQDIPAALAYLQLCEDEIDVRSLGRVTNDTWRFWSDAIIAEVSQEPYQHLLTSTSPRFKGIRDLTLSGKDPLRWSGFQRWIAGL